MNTHTLSKSQLLGQVSQTPEWLSGSQAHGEILHTPTCHDSIHLEALIRAYLGYNTKNTKNQNRELNKSPGFLLQQQKAHQYQELWS